ncbi:MAG: MraY family glycosyltransferase [Myxococcota bacterium]
MDALLIATPLAAGFLASLLMTLPAGRLASAAGAIDKPTARGVNVRSGVPLWGGLGVAAGVACGLWATVSVTEVEADPSRWWGLFVGAGLLVVAGMWDDRFGLSALPKLAVQLVAASAAILSGFEIGVFTDPFALEIIELPRWIVWPASLLWIVGITNAMNLLDGLDGLASGVGAIIGATLSLIAFQAGAPLGLCVGLALVGALLGFLPHNFAPARLFLGDTGSLLIGFLLALVALEGYRRVSLITFVVPLLALAVPILDTSLSIVRRLRMRTNILSADRMHMHHRLLDFEGSAQAAVLQFYFVTAAFCLIAVSFTQLQGVTAIVFLLAVAGLTLRLLWNLGVLDVDTQEGDESDATPQEHP